MIKSVLQQIGTLRTNPGERLAVGNWCLIIGCLAIVASIFHLWVSGIGLMMAIKRNAVHLSFILSLAFLIYPARKKNRGTQTGPTGIDIALAIAGLMTGLYIFFFWDQLAERGFVIIKRDLVFALLTLVLVLEATRRVVGNILVILALCFLLYAYFGPYFPGIFAHRGVPVGRILYRLYLTEEGFFGIVLTISSTYIFFFVLFGTFLQRSGASDLFNRGTMALVGHKQGGPGLVAVISSSFMGMLSGSPISNVVTTGSITIPLMKKVGYAPHFAGAVETAASSGGTIMPPVMGFAAFLMAGILDIPYKTIMIAAILPALMYYVLVLFNVVIEARRLNLKSEGVTDRIGFWEVMRQRGHLLVPIVLLIVLLLAGYSPLFSAWWSIVAIVVCSCLRWKERMRLADILWALESGAKIVVPVAIACAIAGIVIASTTMTGIAQTITHNIVSLSGGVVFYALFFIMLSTILMSMALPISACYITVVVLAAPALIKMGVQPIVAHFFVLWFASLSGMTPPVALTSYSAASIAQAEPNRTALSALKIVAPAFALPYIFVYYPELLWQGTVSIFTLVHVSFFIIGSCLGLAGYAFNALAWPVRLVLLGACLLLFSTQPYLPELGMTLIVVTVVFDWFRMKRSQGGRHV